MTIEGDLFRDYAVEPQARTMHVQRFDEVGNIDPGASFSVRASDFDRITRDPEGTFRMFGPEFSVTVRGNHRFFYEPVPFDTSPVDSV